MYMCINIHWMCGKSPWSDIQVQYVHMEFSILAIAIVVSKGRTTTNMYTILVP